jgi:uncharacterized protein YjaZ
MGIPITGSNEVGYHALLKFLRSQGIAIVLYLFFRVAYLLSAFNYYYGHDRVTSFLPASNTTLSSWA